MTNFQDKVQFIWSIAEILRGDYKPHEYGSVVLPFTVLRRLDCVLEPTKAAVIARAKQLEGSKVTNVEPILNRVAGQVFHNTSAFDFKTLLGDPVNVAANLNAYIRGFSANAQAILDNFLFPQQIERLQKAKLLFQVVQNCAAMDLHPASVSNLEMGYIFEELIRRFSEQSNEQAGEHFTPREVIRLMVHLLFAEDGDALTKPGIVRTLYDPACGTGGMLSVAETHLRELNPEAILKVYGQELNAESFAICMADMMIKGEDPNNIKLGNSFTEDGLPNLNTDFMLSNPPFGVDWKKVEDKIREEADKKGHAGRFGAGLPRVSDGSLLFLQHMISKMKPEGSRLAIVFNGSPLFSGDAGSGESDIRRWIIENDMLEAIVGLPDQLFYNTGINTYIWVVTNAKRPERKGKVQLINAVDLYQKMRRSLGNKRNELAEAHINEIARVHGEFTDGPRSKVLDNEDFGFQKITIERPLRLNFQASSERVERLRGDRAFTAAGSRANGAGAAEGKATGDVQGRVLAALSTLPACKVFKSRAEFVTDLKRAFKVAGVSVPPQMQRSIVAALSERDGSAASCLDAKGNPEPDPDLRDTETVPLKEDIQVYFQREVEPFVPDAWIDESKTKIGYEVPFTRFFFAHPALPSLSELAADIRRMEAEIQSRINEVLA